MMQSLGDGEFEETGKSSENANGAKNQKRNHNDNKSQYCVGQCISGLFQLFLVATGKKEFKSANDEHNKEGNPNECGHGDDCIGKQWF